MILGIDASNLRGGGGVTHLVSLLSSAEPHQHGFERVTVWAPTATAALLPKRRWLDVQQPPALDGPLWSRALWQSRELPRVAESCSLLFAPGGNAPHRHSPIVLMSQNMLPFDARERRRYGLSAMRLRNEILAFTQRNSFRRADGIIFLSRHAERIVTAAIARPVRSVVIPHGIDDQFRREPRPQRSLDACTPAEPFRLLYVSIIDTYKHQWNVAEAVAGLRREGLPVAIRFVGPAYPPALALLDAALRRLDPDGEFMSYDGPLPHAELPKAWVGVDACVFASSCENLPIILLEAMAAGMPIACSDREPMPEVLGTDGMFFDPESPTSIARALRKLATQPKLRDALAWAGFERTREMTWQRCARATLSFLAAVAHATT